MPFTLYKDAGAGAGSDTTLAIGNFSNLVIDGANPADVIPDIADDEEGAILLKFTGPTMTIDLDYTVMQEASDVVTGSGSPVTTMPGQVKYLFDTMMSKGSSQILDQYTLTLDFGGGVTMVRLGTLTRLTCTISGDTALTATGHIQLTVGTVL